jgi:hypothetical protein
LLDPGVGFDATVDAGGANRLDQAEADILLAEIERDAEDDLDDLEVWPQWHLSLARNYCHPGLEPGSRGCWIARSDVSARGPQ